MFTSASLSNAYRQPIVFATVALLSCTSGCGALSSIFGGAFEKPSLEHERVSFENLSLSGLSLNTFWKLNNPNAVGLKIAELDYSLFVDEKQVIAGKPPAGVDIPKQGSAEVVFPADVKFLDLGQVLATFLTKDSAGYRAAGHIGVDTPIGIVTLPLSTSGEFKVPKMPDVQFGSPRVSSFSLKGTTIEFPVKVGNINGFALPLGGIRGALKMEGSNIGELSTGELGLLEAGASKEVSLPLNVSFLELSSAALNAIKKGKGNVQWDAKLQSSGVELPLQVSQLLQFMEK